MLPLWIGAYCCLIRIVTVAMLPLTTTSVTCPTGCPAISTSAPRVTPLASWKAALRT